MANISKNGKSYASADVEVSMFGSMDYEITKLSYSVSQTPTANYSLGSASPTSYSLGKKTYTAEMTITAKSLAKIEKAAGGDLLAIKPFPIVVTYVDDENEIIKDTLLVKFAKQGKDAELDKDVETSIELFCLDIKFNV